MTWEIEWKWKRLRFYLEPARAWWDFNLGFSLYVDGLTGGLSVWLGWISCSVWVSGSEYPYAED